MSVGPILFFVGIIVGAGIASGAIYSGLVKVADAMDWLKDDGALQARRSEMINGLIDHYCGRIANTGHCVLAVRTTVLAETSWAKRTTPL